MNNNLGMNKILLNEGSIEQIRQPPSTAIETFSIYAGSKIKGRDYDIPTAQGRANGVVLYYTPPEQDDKIAVAPVPGVKATANTRSGTKRAASEEGEDAPAPKRRRGLGALDMLPVSPQVILGHGGNRGMLAQAFVEFSKGIARNFPVLTFQKDQKDVKDTVDIRTAGFTYFHLDSMQTCLALGGRSRGARCAVRATTYSSNRNLILWSYPFVRELEVRKQELLDLPADARVLIIKGQKDWMGPEIALQPLRKQMKAKTWQITVQEMDHRFNTRTPEEAAKVCNAIGVIAGIWLRGEVESQPQIQFGRVKELANKLEGGASASAGATTAAAKTTPWDPEHGTEMTMSWDEAEKQVVWTGWRAAGSKADKKMEVNDIAGLD